MNNPEYFITDEMATIVENTKLALVAAGMDIEDINYQYGEVVELNETLQQYEKDPAKYRVKFPLVWLEEPFTIDRTVPGIYGKMNGGRIFIINESDKTWKASERMENNFKPVIYPIYRELLKQIALSPVFGEYDPEQIRHSTTNRYYYGEENKSVLNDVVDTLVISGLSLAILNKAECTPFSNF